MLFVMNKRNLKIKIVRPKKCNKKRKLAGIKEGISLGLLSIIILYHNENNQTQNINFYVFVFCFN